MSLLACTYIIPKIIIIIYPKAQYILNDEQNCDLSYLNLTYLCEKTSDFEFTLAKV